MAKNGESLGHFFGFSLFLLILLLPNVSKKYYHGKGSDKLFAHKKGGLVGVSWDNVVSAHGSATA